MAQLRTTPAPIMGEGSTGPSKPVSTIPRGTDHPTSSLQGALRTQGGWGMEGTAGRETVGREVPTLDAGRCQGPAHTALHHIVGSLGCSRLMGGSRAAPAVLLGALRHLHGTCNHIAE